MITAPDSLKAKALAQKERQDLFKKYAQNSTIENRNAAVKANIGLATSLATQIAEQTFVPFEDLLQIALEALIKCVEKFDLSKGYQFSSYYVPIGRGRLLNYLRDKSYLVRLPRDCYDTMQKAKRTERQLFSELGRLPSDREVANKMGVPLSTLRQSKHAAVTCRYLYDDSPAQHLVSPDMEMCIHDMGLEPDLEALPPLERKIIDLYFQENLSAAQIAKSLKMKESEVKERLLNSLMLVEVRPRFVPVSQVSSLWA